MLYVVTASIYGIAGNAKCLVLLSTTLWFKYLVVVLSTTKQFRCYRI